jgi:hypothetical protein
MTEEKAPQEEECVNCSKIEKMKAWSNILSIVYGILCILMKFIPMTTMKSTWFKLVKVVFSLIKLKF